MQNPNNNYRHIIEQIEDYAILLLDENGVILDWNKGAEKIKGYKAKEIIGKNFRVFYPNQDRENKLPEQLLAKSIAHGSAKHEGFRVRKDGSTFWGSILITALFDKTDKLTGFLKITRDLTEKKELEEKLRKLNHGLEQQVKERTAELQKQFKEISDYKFAIDESSIVAITDLKGIIEHANDNFCKISKYSHAELIGQDHRLVNSGYHSKEFIRDLWVTIANGKIWKGEIKNKAKDGATYWVDTTIVPFLNEAGKPTRYIAIRADITRQKEDKEKLIASEQLFHTTMDNMLEGIQMHDFDWRYIYVNEAHTRYSGLAPEEVLGYSLVEKYPGIEQSDLFKAMNRCMTERVADRLESEFVFPDGRKADFQLSIQPTPEGVVILSVDITERKKAERELQKMNRLYAFISGINKSIVHIKDQEELLQNACTISLEIGKFKLAWIGLLNKEGKLRVVSSQGERNVFDEVYKRTRLSIQNSSLKDTPVGKALRTGLYAISNDVLNDSDMSSLKEELLLTGIRANIAFPLKISGKLAGVFTFHSDTVNAFDEQEIALLQEAADDISFALENFKKAEAHKKAELAIKTSEAEYRYLFDNSPAFVIIWDLETLQVKEVNDIVVAQYGYSKEEWIDMPLLQYRPEKDHEKIKAFAKKMLEEGSQPVASMNWWHVKKNGEEMLMEIASHKITYHGRPCILSLGNDITERKKAEEKLIESENYLRTILNTEPECVKLLNYKGELLYMNPAGLTMIEADNEQQVLGRRMTELVDEKYQTGFNRLSELVFGGKSGTFEFEVTGLKGGHRWLETHAVPLKDTAGEIINLLGVTRDITNRKKTEQTLKESEENYRFLFNNNPAVIFIWDLETLRIVEANETAEALYGYTHDEFMSLTMLGIRLPEEHERVKTAARQMQHNPPPLMRANWQHVKKGGGTMMMDITWHPISYKGRASIFAMAENITEKLLIEEELKRTYEDVRRLNAHLQTVREEERKRIGREIHDELGQQLTAIKMDIVWIDKQIPSETATIKNKLQNIIELLDGSNESIRKILNELRPTMLDENGLLDALQWQAQQFTESTGSSIHFTSNQNSIKLPHETATSIFRVYQEALTNIMRYAEADKVLSSLNVVKDHVILTIEDDGKGFDPSIIKSKKSFGILGMKERVFSLNGKFDLISSPGKGTKIVITLPYDDTLLHRQEETERH